MSWTQSLAMIVPAARQEVCNRLMEALGRGPSTFAAPIRDKATLARVAYAAHTYDDALAASLTAVPQTLPPGVTLADLQAHGFTASTARTAVGHIRFKVVANRQAVANLKARLDELGWEREPVESIDA
jgi:hypothetical protein